MTDRFADFAGAYVLGGLSPEDRQEFERHLPDCTSCSASVRELAGLPGLLAQADAPEVPPSPDVLPALLSRVRRARRRRWAVTAGATVAACLAFVFALRVPDVQRVEMATLASAPVSGAVAVDQTDAGTRVDMTCSYDGPSGYDYVLVAVLHDGSERTLARWHAVPDDTVTIRMATRLRDAQIRALEVRLPDGPAVLRLTR